jgi:LacI family transcriptional regulator
LFSYKIYATLFPKRFGKMPTIRDVAKRLNLSITTVSRALDGYSDVAEETRQRVIKTAHEMGYAPTRAARQLRRQRTETIGYIMPTSKPRFSDPFFSEFIAGLGDEAIEHNFDLLVSVASPNHEDEIKAYQRWVQGRRVDGIILSRMRLTDWRVQFMRDNQFPFTAFGRTQTANDFPHIGVDGKLGVLNLMQHLIKQGHKRIAFITAPEEFTLQVDRFAGYKEGLSNAGLAYLPEYVITGDLTRDGGYHAAKKLFNLPSPPTAIIGANDLTAIGALSAAHELNLKVGKDLAIAGFDGIEDTKHTQPLLTTIKQPVYECARLLVRMLIMLLNGETIPDQYILLKPELIVRASTLRQ